MRTLVIGDIHGHASALDVLLEAARFSPPTADSPGDLLITLGDYIDRGPNSKAVLDRLLALHATGRLIPLLGNHEEMLLDAIADPSGMQTGLWRSCGGTQTLASYGVVRGLPSDLDLIPPVHVQFLRQACRNFYETATHLFTHANLDPDLPLSEQPVDRLRWMKFDEPPRHVSSKILVCGHTRQLNGWPLVHPTAICIDTGIYSGGWLTCLEVETGQFWQVNKSAEVRESNLSALSANADPDAIYWLDEDRG